MPLNKDPQSEGAKLHTAVKPLGFEHNTIPVEFTEGRVLSQNKGSDVSLNTLAHDDASFTGKSEAFFDKFKDRASLLSK